MLIWHLGSLLRTSARMWVMFSLFPSQHWNGGRGRLKMSHHSNSFVNDCSCTDIIFRLDDDFHAGSWNAVQLHHESCYHPRQLQLQTSTSQFIHISTPHLPTILCRCDIPRTILHIPEELHEQVCRATGADCGWEDRQVGFHWWLSHCLITQSSSVVFSPPSPRPIFPFCRMISFNASVIGCVHVFFFWLLVIFGIVLKHL